MKHNDFGSKRLVIELTNICNLHCSYCLRDDDALYHTPANFLSPEFLGHLFTQARQVMGVTSVVFTGGEPTLHPKFDKVLEVCEENGLTASFVTNGWHFERIWPTVLTHRNSISHIAFSLDGSTQQSHDAWRGEGSFMRIVRAFSRCFAAKIPFVVKVGIRRDTIQQLEQISLFAARLGASALNFSHLMPTSNEVEDSSALTYAERELADQEIATLSQIFKMNIGIDVGYHNLDQAAPCSALAGVSCNVDYRGQLSLCCNLSGFRNGREDLDVVANLNNEAFATAFTRLSELAKSQVALRRDKLQMLADQESADSYISSPCLFCLDTFGKLPWREKAIPGVAERALPVIQSR